MPLPGTEVFNWSGKYHLAAQPGLDPGISATSLPQWPPTYTTLAYRVLAGGSAADPRTCC